MTNDAHHHATGARHIIAHDELSTSVGYTGHMTYYDRTRMKCWKILRDYRRAATALGDAVSGIAHPQNIALTS